MVLADRPTSCRCSPFLVAPPRTTRMASQYACPACLERCPRNVRRGRFSSPNVRHPAGINWRSSIKPSMKTTRPNNFTPRPSSSTTATTSPCWPWPSCRSTWRCASPRLLFSLLFSNSVSLGTFPRKFYPVFFSFRNPLFPLVDALIRLS